MVVVQLQACTSSTSVDNIVALCTTQCRPGYVAEYSRRSLVDGTATTGVQTAFEQILACESDNSTTGPEPESALQGDNLDATPRAMPRSSVLGGVPDTFEAPRSRSSVERFLDDLRLE